MANRREQRLRREIRRLKRQAAIDAPVLQVADRYAAEIESPDIRVPWGIANLRDWLRQAVRSRRAARRAA